MKVKLIFNPKAGLQGITRAVGSIIELYATYGHEIVPVLLNFDDDCPRRILEGLDSGEYHHILIAGGDGSINYVVGILRRAGIDLPLGILPAGTANDFGCALGMSKDPIVACKQILEGVEKRIDLGVAAGRCFVNIFSFGLFTNVSQRTSTRLKNVMGKAAYLFEGMSEIAHIHHLNLRVETDTENFEGKALMMLVFNGRTAGSFPLARMSELDDGVLDALILRGDSPISTIEAFIQYIDGIGGLNPPSEVKHIRCSKLHIECDEQTPTDLDGQPGVTFPVDIECLPGAMRIIVPQLRTRKQGLFR